MLDLLTAIHTLQQFDARTICRKSVENAHAGLLERAPTHEVLRVVSAVRTGAVYPMVDVTDVVKRAREHKHNAPALPKLDEVITAYVAEVVELHEGNIAAAARDLGVSRDTVKRALDRARARR